MTDITPASDSYIERLEWEQTQVVQPDMRTLALCKRIRQEQARADHWEDIGRLKIAKADRCEAAEAEVARLREVLDTAHIANKAAEDENDRLREHVRELRSGLEHWPHDEPRASRVRAARLLAHTV